MTMRATDVCWPSPIVRWQSIFFDRAPLISSSAAIMLCLVSRPVEGCYCHHFQNQRTAKILSRTQRSRKRLAHSGHAHFVSFFDMKPLHTDDAITFRFNELSSVVELTASLDEHRGPGESNGCRVGVSTEAVKHMPVSRVGHEDRCTIGGIGIPFGDRTGGIADGIRRHCFHRTRT